ncbi:MAG: hypothetical protein WCY16_10070 [Weeksellaceae bacterium]
MNEEKPVKIYPSEPDSDGFFFVSPEEEEQGIKTRDYKNGSAVKQMTLSNGKIALIRKLKGRDFVETKKRIQNDNTLDFETANMSVAVSIDGKQEPVEFYLDDLWQGDYAKLMIAYSGLNF